MRRPQTARKKAIGRERVQCMANPFERAHPFSAADFDNSKTGGGPLTGAKIAVCPYHLVMKPPSNGIR
jgi:hypothetical protein